MKYTVPCFSTMLDISVDMLTLQYLLPRHVCWTNYGPPATSWLLLLVPTVTAKWAAMIPRWPGLEVILFRYIVRIAIFLMRSLWSFTNSLTLRCHSAFIRVMLRFVTLRIQDSRQFMRLWHRFLINNVRLECEFLHVSVHEQQHSFSIDDCFSETAGVLVAENISS